MKINMPSDPDILKDRSEDAFSLIEVMIAMAIFFMATFAILGLVSQSIGAAAGLKRHEVDIGSLAAELSLTNILQEGSESGDFGNLYPGASWTREISEVSSNGFYRVDFAVVRPPSNGRAKATPVVETMSILLYRPGTARPGFRGPRR
jgi:Tfp pilus assembly protein PilV